MRDGDVTPDTIDRLMLAAGRASQLAKVAIDSGVTDDAGAEIARQRGQAIAAVMRRLTSALLPRVAAGAHDTAALRTWIDQAVPAVLRGQPFPAPPILWRLTFAPALESGETVRRRERQAVRVILGEAEEAVLSGREAVLDPTSSASIPVEPTPSAASLDLEWLMPVPPPTTAQDHASCAGCPPGADKGATPRRVPGLPADRPSTVVAIVPPSPEGLG